MAAPIPPTRGGRGQPELSIGARPPEIVTAVIPEFAANAIILEQRGFRKWGNRGGNGLSETRVSR
jgi:hypothetical protein